MKSIILLLTATTFFSFLGIAQNADSLDITTSIDSTNKAVADSLKRDGRYYLGIGSSGIKISSKTRDSIREHKTVSIQWGMLDIGVNSLNDRSDYGSAAAQEYLHVPDANKNSDLFALNQGKSINVNIWPVLMKVKMLNNRNQKISLYTGAGLQLYNFRFNKDISFLNETKPMLISDSVSFSKNKLAFAYASIPLMLNFKTRLGMDNGAWLTYGFGVIGGYNFNSWTKQISGERGKQKNHDQFNFQQFNLNLSAEIGIVDYVRFYATYQITNMYKDALAQYPFAIGLRFCGI